MFNLSVGQSVAFIAFIVVLLIIIFVGIILYKSRAKKEERVFIKDNYELYEKVIEAIKLTNIISASHTNDRVSFILKDISLVKPSDFQALEMPAFVTGNELKVLYRDNAKGFVEYVNEKIGAGK